MIRQTILAGALALALPALAFAQDPSNPANAPLAPNQAPANMPQAGRVAQNALPASARASMDPTAPVTGDAAVAAEAEADRQAREEGSKAKRPRTARLGERTVLLSDAGALR